METGKKSSSLGDEHNTNQNEAASAGQIVSLELEERFDSPVPDKSVAISVVPGVKGEPLNEYTDIPSIVITPASPILSCSRQGSTCCQIESENFSDVVPETDKAMPDPCPELEDIEISLHFPPDAAKALLCVPSCDNTLNISRPPETKIDPSKCCIGLDDLEVICRCSSTPIKETDRNRQKDTKEHADCSVSSIEGTSPIAGSNVDMNSLNETPRQPLENGAANSARNDSSDITMASPSDTPTMNPMNSNYMYLNSHGPINADTPRPPPQSSHIPLTSHSLPYDMSRGVSPSQLPPSPHSRHHDREGMAGVSGAVYPPHHHGYGPGGTGGYNDYYNSSDPLWTDMSYRSEMCPIQSIPGNMSSVNCCYANDGATGAPSGLPDSEYFVYPSIYVSSAGLISVLLRNDMSVEMTVDRTIRVVSHNHMMAVATDSRGTAASLYHPAVKVSQMGTTTDIATNNFLARMGSGDSIVFSNGMHFFKLVGSELQPTAAIKFSDILRDQSVNLLFSSEGYGESLVASCMQVVAQAEYANLPKGGVIVRINGVKVTQTGSGDVTVVTGAKFIRLSPHHGTTRLTNRFVDIEVEKDWTVKLTRGSHSFVTSRKRSMISNGKMEAGFDENNGLKVVNLVPRHPLLADPGAIRRQMRKPARFLGPSSTTPKRKSDPTGMGRGGGAY